MRRALRLANGGWGRVAPNPLVGAVVVRDGVKVGEGYHTGYGAPHAEVEALRAAGRRARGATLYVTLEPCAHQGKTPACTTAILRSGVRRLVYAVEDPNPIARGGADILAQCGLDVRGGVAEQPARDLNAPFFWACSPEGERRPWVALKLALSLDARIADASGRSAWITGEKARVDVHRLRAGFDAIAVGVGTALADDPQLTIRGAVTPRRPPVRIVFDRLLRLPSESYLARTATQSPVWLVSGPRPPPSERARLERLGVRVLPARDLADALQVLRAQDVRSMICEGGAGLGTALLDASAVDRMYLFYAPVLFGEQARPGFSVLPAGIADARRWRLLESRRLGSDTLITLAAQ